MNPIDLMILDVFYDDPDFKKELKKKRRRENNRISAARSRIKQNNKLLSLENENCRMTQEIEELKEELLGIYTRYGNLRDTLDKLVY
jgi:predicted RNase H-like nuclease (RuvC/YqgF family)